MLLYVCRNLREWDRKEIFATRWNDSADDLAVDVHARCLSGSVVMTNMPVAAFGVVHLWPGVAEVWCFGTDHFRDVGLSLTKHIKRAWMPSLKAMGIHRAQCFSMEGHTEAHSWLEMLGGIRESVQMNYGRNGETFYQYVWRN